MSSSASSSPSLLKRPATSPSVQGLVTQFDDVHLSHPRWQATFKDGFPSVSESKTKHSRHEGTDKSLPPTPSDTSDYTNHIPLILRPGHGREQLKHQNSQFPQVTEPAMQMPIPILNIPSPDQSLTMTFARSAPPTYNDFPSLPMPHPDNDLRPSYLGHRSHSSVPTTTSSPKDHIHLSTSSSPPSFSDSHIPLIQCYGTTKAGKRCSRLVKAPLVSFFAPTSSEPVPRFCHQHRTEILKPSGFYSHKEREVWVEFSGSLASLPFLTTYDYLCHRLGTELFASRHTICIEGRDGKPPQSERRTGVYLCVGPLMVRARNVIDSACFRYEIRDDRVKDEIKIKVGRAVLLQKRLGEWSKQCTSKEVILRGWWPGTVEGDNGINGTSLLRGRIKEGEKGPYCHRLERLVHLELADLAVHAPYLEPGFPNASAKVETVSAPSTPQAGRSPKHTKVRMPSASPCVDCTS